MLSARTRRNGSPAVGGPARPLTCTISANRAKVAACVRRHGSGDAFTSVRRWR